MMGNNSNIWSLINGLKPVILMVIVQTALAGVNILYKLAGNDGMNLRILVAYRFIFASAFIAPIAYFVERKSRPKLTWTVLGQAFLCGLFGEQTADSNNKSYFLCALALVIPMYINLCKLGAFFTEGSLSQNLCLKSIMLTSATFATALGILVPAVTFILSVSFGLEKLSLNTLPGIAKIFGTLLGISGAMLLTFYKGVEIKLTSINNHHVHKDNHITPHNTNNNLIGSLMALAGCFAYSSWLIVQAKMCRRYPCYYSSTALMCIMGAIQSVAFALSVETDWNQWKLGWNIRLVAVAFCGIVASGMMATLIAWCIRLRGPLFVSVFNPLMLVIVAVVGCLMLNEKLYIGSVLGGLLIVLGLYAVIWGKGKEMKRMSLLVARSQTVNESDGNDIVTPLIVDERRGANKSIVIPGLSTEILV